MRRLAASAAIAFSVLLAGCGKAPPEVEGKVMALDNDRHFVTLDHQAIPNIPMPPMTMRFTVTDPKMLDGVKEGDRVKFSADVVDGALTITSLKRG